MGKLLKVFVVILLVLSIGALTLGIMLFLKREILKGRTQRLEQAIRDFDAVIESVPGVKASKPTYEELDLSPCEAELPDTVEHNDFWSARYKHDLEVQEPQEMVRTAARDRELQTYIIKDPATGQKRIKGPGTMDQVLKDLYQKAETQYTRLTETRQALADLRDELVATIKKFNIEKNDHRRSLVKIKELEEEIVRLKAKIEELENKVAELEAQIAPLKDQIAEQERTIAALEEQLEEKTREIEGLKARVSSGAAAGEDMAGAGVPAKNIEAGIKGEVILVNPEWKFVIFKVEDSFFTELTGDDPDAAIPQIELWVKRPDKQETIVTKIRMLQLRKAEKLATGDILSDWQQMPVQKGDIVFFQ